MSSTCCASGAHAGSAGTRSARSPACRCTTTSSSAPPRGCSAGSTSDCRCLTAQRQSTWDWVGRLTGPAEPGSWGGHAVDVVRYSPGTLTAVTWGRLQDLTWAFLDRYCDEAYCIISPDFLRGGHTPNGFDLEALKADLALITA
jgi:hypothetical protein